MSKKSQEQHLQQAQQEMSLLEQMASERLVGVFDVIEVMNMYDSASSGADAYASFVENATYCSVDVTAGN